MCVVRRWLVAAACLDTTPRDRLGMRYSAEALLRRTSPMSFLHQAEHTTPYGTTACCLFLHQWEMLDVNQRGVQPSSRYSLRVLPTSFKKKEKEKYK